MMRDKLLKIINESKTNKHTHNVSKNKEVYNWVLTQTQHLTNVSFLERIYCVLNDVSNICNYGRQRKFTENLKLGYMACGKSKTCQCYAENQSRKISAAKQLLTKEDNDIINNKREQTNLIKYGVKSVNQLESIKEKKKQTNLDKYGVITNLLHEDTKNKIQKTLLEKYGVTNPLKLDIIKKKVANTNLTKYGNICSAQNTSIRSKIYSDHYEKFGVKLFPKNIYTDEQIAFLTDQTRFKADIDEHGVSGCSIKYDLDPSRILFRLESWGFEYEKKYTILEYFVKSLLDEHNVNYIFRDRQVIKPYELDFVLPDQKIAIEVGGLYWHSEKHVDKDYHQMKLNKCNEQNYRLITIFSDEIDQKSHIVKSRLEHILGLTTNKIYARKCSIKPINKAESKDFLNAYHLQGNAGAQILLGAYYKSELVSVMTFGKNRNFTGDKSEYYEMVRFASKTNVVGIAGKLLSYFIKNFKPNTIISYADRRWSDGNLYKQLGFELEKISGPNYWYTKDMLIREHRYNYTKRSLVKKGFDSNLTESVIMAESGYSKIWDCGTFRFKLDL